MHFSESRLSTRWLFFILDAANVVFFFDDVFLVSMSKRGNSHFPMFGKPDAIKAKTADLSVAAR